MNSNLAHTIKLKDNSVNAKPFLKWAGGKSQLIPELSSRLPKAIIDEGVINSYIEPFVGGGAFFFYLKSKYQINKAYLFDINKELIVCYKVLQSNPKELITHLTTLEMEYKDKNEDERRDYYYKIREKYNFQINTFDYNNYGTSWIERAAFMIFLNRTCFNGLFRQNRNGEFNVPYGRYKNPKICDIDNIKKVNLALRNTDIICGDFSKSIKYVDYRSLVYFDPPYRPLNPTSSFTSYSKEEFTDEDQKRLAEFYKELDKKGAYLILSNSDPKNQDPNDNFFDDLYKGFVIERVNAKRLINCDPNRRGEIKELIIRNFN